MLALAARDTDVLGIKLLGFGIEAIKRLIDHARFQAVPLPHRNGREGLALLHPLFPLLQCGHRLLPHGLSLGRVGGRKHHQIVIRHHHLQGSPVRQSFSLAQFLEFGLCIAHLSTAGHDEVGVPTAAEMAADDKIFHNSGNLPAVGGHDKHPGLL